ncbi:hypothetical protein RJ640_019415 [Escallonia rubra]|uniref:Ribulose bisphosphate carboxylase large chain n=4 Tax=Pentapetalae TaxID=1437201 RepID=A0AA88UF25_9ASTE|nr:hypothetical protein RJ640_019415 [Escallonia rubra]
MSPQTETKTSVGFKAGVKDYKLTYYTPDYETKETDILAAFRVTPQPGVPPEEAGAAVAAESSTGTWTTVWTDGLTSLDRYKGRCYQIEPVAGEENQYIAYVAYPLDLFEEGSVTNMFTSIVGNVFGFKALRALRLEDLRIPVAYVKTFQGPPHGIQVERDKLNKYGRPLLGSLYKAQAETGEIKGHYLNATAGTCEEMIKRAVFARELGVPIVMHDYLTGGFTANTSLAHYCRDNGLLLHIHRAMHAVIDRQKNHGIHFRVLAKALRMSGGDHIHSGTFDGGTLGHPWGNAPGAVANRVALEACVQARNEGRDLAREGNEIIREACKWSPELAAACEGARNSMERWWFNSMLFKKEFKHRCGLSKSTDSLGPIENTSESEDLNINDTDKNIPSWSGRDTSSYINVDHLFGVKDIRNFISDDTFLVRDSNGDSYSIYFDIENQSFEINNGHSFRNELESSFYSDRNSSYLNNGSKNDDPHFDRSMYDTQYSWNTHINSCIDSYLQSQISIDTYIVSDIDNYSDSYIYSSICGESGNSNEGEGSSIRTSTNGNDLTIRESSNDLDVTQKYRHLWVQCENCYGLNYKKFFKSKMNICEQCGYHLKMSSSDRIELSIDPGTWDPMDEDMVSLDPIEFHSEEEPYKDRIDSYQRKTGLTEAVQTGIGQLNGIPVAIGVMDQNPL